MKSNITRRDFLKRSLLAFGALSCPSVSPLSAKSTARVVSRYDTIIANGLVVDGSAQAVPLVADVGIRGHHIEAIGQLGRQARHVIDATGMVVCPGFVDIHSHTDTNLLQCPAGDSRIFQGVTTDIGGNCGGAPFPNGPYNRASDFFKTLRTKQIGINYASYTGQGDLRSAVVGEDNVAATARQIKAMQDLLDAQLRQGSIGLSCGLEYAPGAYASTDELVALLHVVARHDGLFAIHMRNEDDHVEEAVDEALDMAREAGVRLQISHLKAQNQANWHKGPALLQRIERARAEGIDVAFDRYPYTAFSTGLTSFIPLTDRAGTQEEVLARLHDNQKAAEMGEYARQRFERLGGTQNVVLSSCSLPHNRTAYMGKNLEQCATLSGMTAWDFVRALLIEEALQPEIIAFAMTEDNVRLFLSHPLGMPASDGSVYSPQGPLAQSMPHPRSYGTFAHFYHQYCHQEGLLDLPTAIHKMTALPASRLPLKKRGQLKNGYAADVVVFDPDTFCDTATFEQPHQFASGLHHVWVNGVHTLCNGTHTGALAGEVL